MSAARAMGSIAVDGRGAMDVRTRRRRKGERVLADMIVVVSLFFFTSRGEGKLHFCVVE